MENPGPTMTKAGKIGLFFDISILALLAVFAFRITFQAGTRGFFAFDQSIVFDGGYRVLLGQIPYRDFIIPIGPVAFWLQAVFFALLGVNYYACIFPAALFNVLAAFLAVGTIRLLFPGKKIVSYGAGFLTAAWFYPPFGILYYDQTAFFFSFLALYIILLSILKAPERPLLRTSLLALSGILVLVSFLSKQNAGLFFLPIFPLLLLAGYRRGIRGALLDCAVFFAAFCAGLLAFLAWVHTRSDLSDFITFFFKVPSQQGIWRIFNAGGIFGILHLLYTGDGPVTIRIIIAFSRLLSVFFILFYCWNIRTIGREWRRQLLAALICLYCSFYQYLFLFTTKNNPENCLPFIGLIFGIGAALATCLLADMTIKMQVLKQNIHYPGRSTLRRLAILILALFFFYSLNQGRKAYLSRKVHEVFVRPVFGEPSSIVKLRGLRWGKYTRARAHWNYPGRKEYMKSPAVTESDFASLLDYLGKKGSHFFVFPDTTILYGLLDATPPQPLLWFDEGLTYPREYDPVIDRRIVKSLEENNVDTIVLEEESFWGTEKRLGHFPLLKSYIDGKFEKVKQFGIFAVHEKSELQQDPEAGEVTGE